MTIQEMHQLFRVVGQQMGMQTIRAILPEEIDVFLNMAINEKVREVLLSNVILDEGTKLMINNNPSPINYIRTLYKQYVVENNEHFDSIFSITDLDAMYFTSFGVTYADNVPRACRLVEPDKIYNVLADYCSAPTKNEPVVTIYTTQTDDLVAQVYNNNNNVYKLIINYISNPIKVAFDKDHSCDLPEYTHNEIVQLAVQKYFNSVGSTTHNVE